MASTAPPNRDFRRVRPALGGLSIGIEESRGTLTCVVASDDGANEFAHRQYLLTVAHALPPHSEKLEVMQPGTGRRGDLIATVHKVTDLTKDEVDVDAALLLIRDWADVAHGVLGLGPVQGCISPQVLKPGTPVSMMGWASGRIAGRIGGLDTEFKAENSATGRVVKFVHQIAVDCDGKGPGRGDSGALVVDAAGRAVGILVAVENSGNYPVAWVTPINRVLKHFDVGMVAALERSEA